MTRLIRLVLHAPSMLLQILRGTLFRSLECVAQLMPPDAWGCRIRGLIYRPLMKRCGRNFQVGLHAKMEHLQNIEVGDDVYIGHGSWISGLRGGISFGDEVMLGPYVTMVSSNHRFERGSARFPTGLGAPIRIGSGTWIASGASVVAGVTIGASCLVAAGCVVTKDVPEGSIVGGVPGRVIGSTSNTEE